MGAQQSQSADEYGIPSKHQIQRIHKPTPQEFLKKYYDTKTPVIISGMMDDWPALEKWTKEFLMEKIGDNMHTFWYGKESIKMKVRDYIEAAEKYQQLVIQKRTQPDIDIEEEARKLFPVLPKNTDEKIPYMRHFGPLSSKLSALAQDVKPESLFPEPEKISFRNFLFLGVLGTKTNIHYDDSDNFMALLSGEKLITLLPPGGEEEMNLTDEQKQRLRDFEALPFADPEDLKVDFKDSSKTRMMHQHPVFESAKHLYYSPVKKGEIVFFPAKWYHYIHNVDMSLSLTIQTVRLAL